MGRCWFLSATITRRTVLENPENAEVSAFGRRQFALSSLLLFLHQVEHLVIAVSAVAPSAAVLPTKPRLEIRVFIPSPFDWYTYCLISVCGLASSLPRTLARASRRRQSNSLGRPVRDTLKWMGCQRLCNRRRAMCRSFFFLTSLCAERKKGRAPNGCPPQCLARMSATGAQPRCL